MRELRGVPLGIRHPAVNGDGASAAHMLEVAAEAYGWSGGGLVEAMLASVERFQDVVKRGIPG